MKRFYQLTIITFILLFFLVEKFVHIAVFPWVGKIFLQLSQITGRNSRISGRNKHIPINAWYVEIDSKNKHLSTEIVVSNDLDRRETPSQFAERMNATVVLNGDIFSCIKFQLNMLVY